MDEKEKTMVCIVLRVMMAYCVSTSVSTLSLMSRVSVDSSFVVSCRPPTRKGSKRLTRHGEGPGRYCVL